MRRSDKEICDRAEIEEILRRAEVCRIALCDGNRPYLVPMNFAYRDNALYLHAAREGKKLEIIRANSRVCVEVESDVELVRGGTACDWGMRYRSVVGHGTAVIIDDRDEKIRALEFITEKYTGKHGQLFDDRRIDRTAAIRIDLHECAGKRSGMA